MSKKNTNFLDALLENDSKIISELYKKVYPKVLKFIHQNKGNVADAQDIFQKALIQITVRYRTSPFEIKSSFEAYLFTACKNLWRRELNKSKNRVTDSGIVELESEDQNNALAIIEQERWELFTEKLKELSDNCQKILKLFFKKASPKTIASEMDYNSETVARQRVFKCKAKLKEVIIKDKRFKNLKEL